MEALDVDKDLEFDLSPCFVNSLCDHLAFQAAVGRLSRRVFPTFIPIAHALAPSSRE
jgi:hypothetical protein